MRRWRKNAEVAAKRRKMYVMRDVAVSSLTSFALADTVTFSYTQTLSFYAAELVVCKWKLASHPQIEAFVNTFGRNMGGFSVVVCVAVCALTHVQHSYGVSPMLKLKNSSGTVVREMKVCCHTVALLLCKGGILDDR